jgi:hypothetical protein
MNEDDRRLSDLHEVYCNLIMRDDDSVYHIAMLIEMSYLRGRLESLGKYAELSDKSCKAEVVKDLIILREKIASL